MVVLTFDDPVDLQGSTIVVDGQGGDVTLTVRYADASRRSLAATVPAGFDGPRTLRWRALADDGHVTTGTLPVLSGGAASSTASSPHPSDVPMAFAAVRFLSFASLVVLAGGLAFLGGVWPGGGDVRRARGVLWVAIVVGAASSATALVLLGATTRQLPISGAFTSDVLRDAVASHAGHGWMARTLLFLLAVVVVRSLAVQGAKATRSAAWRLGAAAVGIGLVRSPGLIAHSGESSRSNLGSVADLLHLAGAAVWLGGLVMLAVVVLPRRNAAELESVVPRYSSAAFIAVVVVVAAGTLLAWQLVGGVHELVTSHYGHVLLTKLAVVAALLLVAQRSKQWVARRLDMAVVLDGDRAVIAPFVRSVAIEVALAAATLAVAASLVATNPAR
jgi:putative copper export protein